VDFVTSLVLSDSNSYRL